MSGSDKKNKGSKSKDTIIETSLKLFAKKGYDNSSAQEIADICGISQATVFYHFKNKKVLFGEIVNFVIQNNRNIFEEMDHISDDPFERLVLLLEANIRWCREFPAQTKMILLLFNFAACDSEIKELATSTINRGRDLVLVQLNEIHKNKDVKHVIELKELATIIQQYVNAVMFQMLAQEDVESVYRAFENNIRGFLKKLIYA
jgi:AcrR family transcriptional regulator